MARTGRPTGCTAEVTERVAQWVQNGNDPLTACLAEGVVERTARSWFQRAEEAERREIEGGEPGPNDGAYLHFLREVTRARARFECQAVTELNTAEQGGKDVVRPDTRPKQWLLERVFPERYGQKVTVAIQEEAAQALARRLSEVDPELAAKVAEALRSG